MTSSTSSTSPEQTLEYFDGALQIRILDAPDRSYAFEATFRFDHPLTAVALQHKPPLHFHPYQTEHIAAVRGTLAVDVRGQRTRELAPADPPVAVPPGTHHRLYPLRPDAASGEMAFRCAGSRAREVFAEDMVFLRNLYGYQDELIRQGRPVDLLQILCMFDAAGSYVSLPAWVPFGRAVSRGLGIVVGRWLASLLGYQPYYEKWSGEDWEHACRKMRTSRMQRRFATKSRTE